MEGIIKSIQPFGCFVKLDDTVDGLIPISHCATGYVKDINTIFNVGDVVRFKIIGYEENKGYKLSIKEAKKAIDTHVDKSKLDDKIAAFMKIADDKHTDLKRSLKRKQGVRKIIKTRPH